MDFYALYFMLVIFLIGAVVGSFLNVVIIRLPVGLSVVSPPSHCTNCHQKLKWWQLIPIVSYLLLWGRCGYCGVLISIQYPLVELSTALSFLAIYLAYGVTWTMVIYWILISCLIALTIIDIRHLIIPDGINAIIITLGLAASLTGTTIGIVEAAMGSLVGGGLLLALAILSKGGMGGGDVKLAFGLGLFTGWQLILLLIFLASLMGFTYGIGQIVLKGQESKQKIPFGPFLAIATVAVLHWGYILIEFYLKMIL